MTDEVECRRSGCGVSACAWMGWMRERDCGQQEALAKGEPRVNTESKTVREAVFWKPSDWNNGYNCFRLPSIRLVC